jgi:hypothetical protein
VGAGTWGNLAGNKEKGVQQSFSRKGQQEGTTMNWRTLKEYQKWEFRKESFVVGGGGQVEQKNVGNGREYRVGSTE